MLNPDLVSLGSLTFITLSLSLGPSAVLPYRLRGMSHSLVTVIISANVVRCSTRHSATVFYDSTKSPRIPKLSWKLKGVSVGDGAECSLQRPGQSTYLVCIDRPRLRLRHHFRTGRWRREPVSEEFSGNRVHGFKPSR